MSELAQQTRDDVDPRFAAAESLFFVIGAQKAGTSWLHDFCCNHPEICVPLWKECNYWSIWDNTGVVGDQLRGERRRREKWRSIPYKLRQLGILGAPLTNLEKIVDHLLRAVCHPGPPHKDYADALFHMTHEGTRACGEISPQYARLDAETYRKMFELNPKTRFIFSMRDPVSRYISAMQHGLRGWAANSGYVETDAAVSAIMADIEKPDLWSAVDTEYLDTIERLERYVPRADIHYVFFEDLFEQHAIDRFCDFIGVSRKSADFDKKVNPGGDLGSRLPDSVRVALANRWAHVYRGISEKFGDAVPAKWAESAALITDDRLAYA